MPNEEKMNLTARKKHLRLTRTRHLTASIADFGPQIVCINGRSRDESAEGGCRSLREGGVTAYVKQQGSGVLALSQ
jgi:hypothetical protein